MYIQALSDKYKYSGSHAPAGAGGNIRPAHYEILWRDKIFWRRTDEKDE
jgi:hypothetical protein